MSEYRVGRIVLDGEPEIYQVNTGEIVVGGSIDMSTRARAEFLRRQIAALAEVSSEPVVPVVIDGGFQGFVQITEASTTPEMLSLGTFQFQVTGVPVVAAEAPVIETSIVSTDRAGYDSGEALHCVPDAVSFYGPSSGQSLPRTVEGGMVIPYFPPELGDEKYGATWSCPPESWYVGACEVDVEADGMWLPVTSPQGLRGSWKASNGMTRVWAGEGDTTGAAGLLLQGWNGTSWSAPQTVDLIVRWDGTSPAIMGCEWAVAQIVHLGPERVSLVLNGRAAHPTSGFVVALRVYVTLRRGQPWVDIRVALDTSAISEDLVVLVNPKPGATWEAVTPGFPWTSETSDTAGFTAHFMHPDLEDSLDSDPWGGGEYPLLVCGTAPFTVAPIHSSYPGGSLSIGSDWWATGWERTVVGARV